MPSDIDNKALRDLYRKFDALMHMSSMKWFGVDDCFAIHPKGRAEPVFVHPISQSAPGNGGFFLIDGWAAEALNRRIKHGMPHAKTRGHEVPYLLCAMAPANAISEEQRQLAIEAGYDVETRSVVPAFASFRPGWLPWRFTAAEVSLAVEILDQALGVLLRCESDKSIVYAKNPGVVWVRRRREDGGWDEGWTDYKPFVEPFADRQMEVPENLIESVMKLPDDMPPVEFAFDCVPALSLRFGDSVKIRGEGGRMPMGYFFAFCPHGDSVKPVEIKDNGVFYPANDLGSLRKFFPNAIARFFLEKGRRSKEILVSSGRMMEILRPLQMRIPFKMTFHEKLPNYDALLAMVQNPSAVVQQKR